MSKRNVLIQIIVLLLYVNCARASDAAQIVKEAVEYWRDASSYIEADMTIHRPTWERTSSLKTWTKGSKRTLVRFTAPAKDAGNASLTLTDDIWSYSPKVNRVIKIPPSMMTQSWMGSDFSYDDLSKSDHIVDEYKHTLLKEEKVEGKTVYVIESVPNPDAAIVWGKEILKIRDDHILLERSFYDQDGKLVKSMLASEIKIQGGKLYASKVRMVSIEAKDEWTEVVNKEVKFGINISDSIFTQANLSNPRE